jgi:hypothetical protein
MNRVSLHDGVIRGIEADSRAATLTLHLHCGDLQKGYFDVVITYTQVLAVDGAPSVQAILKAADLEIIQDEVDLIPPGVAEHRFLFSPDGELRVRFMDIDYIISPAANRLVSGMVTERAPHDGHD